MLNPHAYAFGSLFLAGSDTTAKTLSWTVYFLAKHPEMLLRCREEALRVAPLRYGTGTKLYAEDLIYDTRAVII